MPASPLPLVLMVAALALPATRPAFATGPASCPEPVVAAVDDTDDAAGVAYEAGRWDEAFRRHAARADAGDAASARVALLMWRHGQALYGQPFEASPAQRAAWLTTVTDRRRVALACPAGRTAQASQ